jgi:type IV secretion system protein TrbL
MPAAALNDFLTRFLGVADAGFTLIGGDVGFVLNALIVVSIALAGAQWALGQEAPVAPMFRKVLCVGFFAFLVNNWASLTTAVNQTGALLGLKAGGGAMSLADFHNPGAIAATGAALFGRTLALTDGMNILTDFASMITIFLAALCVLIGFFVLALQIFVALIAFKLGALAAFVALPWGVFNGTAWIAERPLGWVAGCAIRLFVLALIASVAVTFSASLPAAFTLDAGGVLNVLLFGLTILALAWFGPHLAAEVVQGQPSLAAADAVRAGLGAGALTIGAGAGGVYLVRAATRAIGAGPRPPPGGGGGGGNNGAGAGPRGGAPLIDHARFVPRRRSGRTGP